jgi:uncharacterized protein
MGVPTPRPQRTCVGCRRRTDAAALVRVVRSPDGLFSLGTGPGRGAWLCAGNLGCFDRAIARGGLAWALRTQIGQTDALALREALVAAQSTMEIVSLE